MKKIATSFTLRVGIAIALSLSFITHFQLRVSTAAGASFSAAGDVKSESQYRSEASRYDGAIRAIAGIATMKLETPDDLKKAIAILDRERPNLKLHFSKFVVLALGDSTFSGAVKRKSSTKAAAEALIKQTSADRNEVLKLDGAASLKTRVERSAESDAAVLRRAGERLKEAVDKIRKASQGRVDHGVGAAEEFKVVRAGFTAATQPISTPDTLIPSMPIDPITIAAVGFIALVVLNVVLYGALIIKNVSTEEGRDAVGECQERADDRYLSCMSGANFFQQAACYASWLLDQSVCLVAPE